MRTFPPGMSLGFGRGVWLLIALCFFGGLRSGFATQFVPATPEALAARAQLILRGTVLSQRCQRDEQGRIYTRLELEVAEVWKGVLATNRFTVVHGGGILGDQKVVVSGQAEYRVGEEVVLFLVLNARGEGVSLGLAQGKYRVVPEEGTGVKHVQRSVSPRVTASRPLAAASVVALSGTMRLEEFKARIKAAQP